MESSLSTFCIFIDQHRCHSYRDICRKLSPTLKKNYSLGHNFWTTWPIFKNIFLFENYNHYLHFSLLLTNIDAIVTEIFAKKLSPTLENITFLGITFEPLDRFRASSNLNSLFWLPFRKKKVLLSGQTDGQTDTFFFADFAFLDMKLCPWKHMPFFNCTNVVVNTLAPVLRTGLKILCCKRTRWLKVS